MIKIAFFDFSKTVAKDTGFGSGPVFLGRKREYDNVYIKFKSGKIKEKAFVTAVIKLWRGFKEQDLPKLYSKIRLNPNIKLVLSRLRKIGIKSALVSYIPTKLAELYRHLGFDYLSGTECELKNGIFTGKIIKMNTDKALVIKKICKLNNVNLNNSIAIGDSINDIKMFKAVGFKNSFAYNSPNEIKKHAKYYITDFKQITPVVNSIK